MLFFLGASACSLEPAAPVPKEASGSVHSTQPKVGRLSNKSLHRQSTISPWRLWLLPGTSTPRSIPKKGRLGIAPSYDFSFVQCTNFLLCHTSFVTVALVLMYNVKLEPPFPLSLRVWHLCGMLRRLACRLRLPQNLLCFDPWPQHIMARWQISLA